MKRGCASARTMIVISWLLVAAAMLAGQTPEQRVAVEFRGRVADDRLSFEFREKPMKVSFERGVLKDGYYPLLNLDMYFKGWIGKRPIDLERGNPLSPMIIVEISRPYIDWATKGAVRLARSLAFWDPGSRAWRSFADVAALGWVELLPSEEGTFRFRVLIWPVSDYIIACF